MPATTTRALAVVAFAVVAAACSSSPADTATGAPTGSSPAASSPTKSDATESEMPKGDPVELLEFEAPLLGGGTFDGTSLAGKNVAFWFWAPW